MCCGEERINLPNKHTAANAAPAVSPGKYRLRIVKSSPKLQSRPQASGVRVRGPVTGRYSAQYGGLHLV